MATSIFTHLEGSVAIPRHEHVAVLYRNQSAAYRLVPFVAEGLRKGDLCQVIAAGAVYFGNPQQPGGSPKELSPPPPVGNFPAPQSPRGVRRLRRPLKSP